MSAKVIEPLPVADKVVYQCPGEYAPISRAVHLARLAADFEACIGCPQADDHLGLPRSRRQRVRIDSGTSAQPSLVVSGGVRAIRVNQLNRTTAIQWGESLASLLWQMRADPAEQQMCPSVVVGYGCRTGAPEIASGIGLGLLRGGCNIVDLGLSAVTWVPHLTIESQSQMGLFITGHGRGAEWIGFDVCDHTGWPLSHSLLASWEERVRTPGGKLMRRMGRNEAVRVDDSYWQISRHRFHAIRPLKLVVSVADPIQERSMAQLVGALPIRVEFIKLPLRSRTLLAPDEADSLQMKTAIVNGHADLGCIIEEDGRTLHIFDERGDFCRLPGILNLMIQNWFHDESGQIAVAGNVLAGEVDRRLNHRHVGILRCTDDWELGAVLANGGVRLGIESSGRIWIRESILRCDGAVTLGLILQSLSRSDLPASQQLLSANS